ncbi:ATP-dependent DNA helicase [Stetteria hydrogenophila]
MEGFPYDEFRPGQAEAAKAVEEAVREGVVLALRAPTGFGKTAAVIYGLLRAGAERVLWAVRTVNEIDPVLRELKAFKARYTFLFSARRSCPLLKGSEMSSEEFWAACRLARLRGECSYYARLGEVEAREVEEYVRSHYSIHATEVARDLARHLHVCPFFALKALAADAQFIVVTYPYVFREDIRETALDPLGIEDFVLVVDEAHSLVNAHTMAEARLALDDLSKAIDEMVAAGYKGEATEFLGKLLAELKRRGRPREAVLLDKEKLLQGVDGVLDDLEAIAEDILSKKLMEALTGGGGFRSYTLRLAKWLRRAADEASKLFLDVDERGRVVVKAMPVDPARVARDPLERARAVVLMSGTLPPSGFVAEVLGVARKTVEFDVEAAGFKASRSYVAIVARDVTTRFTERSPGMYRRIAEYVAVAARILPGAKLAVYPSYDVMREVVERLPVDIDLVAENPSTDLAGVRRRILENPGILVNAVAGGKLVEGVEFTDYEGRNLLHTVILVGVPFPQPDVYTREYQQALAARLGRSKARFYAYEIQAYIRAAQALGRAIRSPSDRAVYILLDHRYLQRRLKLLLKLRYNRVVGSPDELANVLEKVKAVIAGGAQQV